MTYDLRLKTHFGFTLIEVLTTLVILSVGAIAIHQAFGRSIQAVKHSEEALLASHLAEASFALAELESWHSEDSLKFSSDREDLKAYPGFASQIASGDYRLNDLDFTEGSLKIFAPSGHVFQTALLFPKNSKGNP